MTSIIEKISEFAPKFVNGATITVNWQNAFSLSTSVVETGSIRQFEITWCGESLPGAAMFYRPFLTVWCDPTTRMTFHDKSELELELKRDDIVWPIDTIEDIEYFGGDNVRMLIRESHDPRFCGPLHVKITR